MKKGLFLTIEGGEGSGKTTLASGLETKLKELGYEVMITREPGGVEVAEDIRHVIMDYDINPKTEALLFAAARVEHLVKKVLPAIEKGVIVISDRYIDSSLVYQGFTRGLGIDKVRELNLWATDNYLPDAVFFLDLEPEIGLKRIADNEREVNRFDEEKIDFHNKLIEGYRKVMSDNEKAITINADQDINIVIDEAFNSIKGLLNE